MTAPLLVLVGLPGAGKTTVAKAAAGCVGCDVVELDDEIERLAGAPIDRIFSEVGEAAFRRFEVEATRELLKRNRPAIVSAGGGWIANARARALVPSIWRVVYLRVSPRVAAERLAAGAVRRPLLAGAQSAEDVAAKLEHLAAIRVPLYARAHTTIDTEAQPLPDVIKKIAELASAFLFDKDQQ